MENYIRNIEIDLLPQELKKYEKFLNSLSQKELIEHYKNIKDHYY